MNTFACCAILAGTIARPEAIALTTTLAYVGPGAGLTMLGALIAVGCVLLVALAAPLLYPIHILRRWLQRTRHAQRFDEGGPGISAPAKHFGVERSRNAARRRVAVDSEMPQARNG